VIKSASSEQGQTPVPSAGTVNKGVSGAGVEARFGPPGSPFANTFYALTAFNNTIYQVTADGRCTLFVTLDAERVGAPLGIVFPTDGRSMLVSVSRGGVADMGKGGAIARVSPDGKVDEKPLVTAPSALTGMDFAREGFGAYAGHLFVADTEAVMRELLGYSSETIAKLKEEQVLY
jgi:hypothetical protein